VVWHGPTMWVDDVYFKFGLYRPPLEPNPAGGGSIWANEAMSAWGRSPGTQVVARVMVPA